MKNIKNKLVRILDRCKICGRLWDEEGNLIKLIDSDYRINNEFTCEDCQKDFYRRG